MDTKRLILAFVLIMGFLWLYNAYLMPPPSKVAPQSAPAQALPAAPQGDSPASNQKGLAPQMASASAAESLEPTVDRSLQAQPAVEQAIAATRQSDQIVVETPLYIARFSNKGASLVSFLLKGYTDDKSYYDRKIAKEEKPLLDLVHQNAGQNGIYPFQLSPFEGDPLLTELNGVLYDFGATERIDVNEGVKELVFRYSDPQRAVSIEKRFSFDPDSYQLGVRVNLIQNGKERLAPMVFGPAIENNVSIEERGAKHEPKISAFNGTDMVDKPFKDIKSVRQQDSPFEKGGEPVLGQFYWSAYHNTYFAAVFHTDPRISQVSSSVMRQTRQNEKGEEIKEQYAYMIVDHFDRVFMGPKDERVLAKQEGLFPSISKIVEYGWFGIVAKWMLKGIQLIHGFVPNYGWAIILFTILLKLVLFPLTFKSSVSMAKMQELQPKIKALKKKYKNMKDPEQRRNLNIETMELYKREKVNPAGGCLPLLIQMPILLGFFQLLSVSISVRHEPWSMWLHDLSIKDPYYILPILFGVTQILITRMTPSSGDAMNKKIMYLMPVFFTFIVLSLPSGLTLYWFISNLLQMGQQQIINERVHKAHKIEEQDRKKERRKAIS